jgi:hypothetical protein
MRTMAFMASQTRSRAPYNPLSAEPYGVSRSKLELFLECPRCFVMDRRHGIARPDGPPFTLNLAVDALLKREFDAYRLRGEPHPLMRTYGVDAIPLKHPQLREWRDTPTGIRALHRETNFLLFGIVDDLWVDPSGALIVVDYKAASVGGGVHVGDLPRLGYERQLETYQWIFRQNGFTVSPTAYLVYANADKDRATFDRRLEFMMHLVPHIGDTSWIEDALIDAKACLDAEVLPAAGRDCRWCLYRERSGEAEVQSSDMV